MAHLYMHRAGSRKTSLSRHFLMTYGTTDGSNGKFIGLDHVVALGDNGETVTAYYR